MPEPSPSTVYSATNFVREALAAGPRPGFLVERDAVEAGLDRGHTAAAKRALGVVVELIDNGAWKRAIWRLPDAAGRAKFATEPPAGAPRRDEFRPRPRRQGNRITVELGTDNPVEALERALRDFAPILNAAKTEARRRVAFVPPSAARKAKADAARRRQARARRKSLGRRS